MSLVDDVDERDDPFEDGSSVTSASGTAKGSKGNCKSNLNEDEGQLDPEGCAQDTVLAEVDTQALILSASEDGRNDVSNNEDDETNVVSGRVVDSIQDGQQDQANGTDDSKGASKA